MRGQEINPWDWVRRCRDSLTLCCVRCTCMYPAPLGVKIRIDFGEIHIALRFASRDTSISTHHPPDIPIQAFQTANSKSYNTTSLLLPGGSGCEFELHSGTQSKWSRFSLCRFLSASNRCVIFIRFFFTRITSSLVVIVSLGMGFCSLYELIFKKFSN